MCGPHEPHAKRGAGKGTPKSQKIIRKKSHQDTQAASALQAEKLHRLYFFCRSTAISIAALAFGVCR
jgi:hypothetical protein